MCFGMEERRGLYSSSGENMNGKALIRVDKWKENHEPRPLWEAALLEGCSQKRNSAACKGTSLLGSGIESLLIFYTKNKKK